MKTRDTAEPTMSREKMADDYPRLKREYTLLHEEYRHLKSEKDKQLRINNVVQPEAEKAKKAKYCDQCGEPIKKPHKFWCEK